MRFWAQGRCPWMCCRSGFTAGRRSRRAFRRGLLGAGLLFAGALNKRFHFGEVGFEGFAAGGGELVFRSRNSALEAFVANDVVGILEFAGMHTEVAVGGVEEAIEIREAQRVVDREGADDAEAKAFVDDAV